MPPRQVPCVIILGVLSFLLVGLPYGSSNSIRFLSFYGNGNAEQVTTNDVTALVNANANMVATNNLTVCTQAWHEHKLKCMLTVDWMYVPPPTCSVYVAAGSNAFQRLRALARMNGGA